MNCVLPRPVVRQTSNALKQVGVYVDLQTQPDKETPSAVGRIRYVLRQLGPGLVTGAADDDPSGIATYSQAGAQFGFGMLWTVLFTYPLMVGIQVVSARIGRVTGMGVTANIRRFYPPWLLYILVSLLLFANTINIAADIGAMGEALQLIIGGPPHGHAVMIGVVSLLLQVFMPYPRYAPLLKWMVLALFAYVATVFAVQVPWTVVLANLLWPAIVFRADYVLTMVAVFGTTISPYLFFWQASQEVEDQNADADASPLISAPEQAKKNLWRIKVDTYIGMGFSNLIALFIMLTAAVTLHAHGITDIKTSAQAAEALRPIAGNFAFVMFSIGIIGTGMLAIPVLAGSAAYAGAEALQWRTGLSRKPLEARGFYGIIAIATLIGVAIDFTPIDPIKALIWSAVVNGVIAVPIMSVMLLMAAKSEVMGAFVISTRLRILGWAATLIMAAAVLAMLVSWL